MKKIEEIKQEVYSHMCSRCPNAVTCHEDCEECDAFQESFANSLSAEWNPVIHFTEEDWKRMKDDANDESTMQDCYGTISIGGIHADIDLFESCEAINGEWISRKPQAGSLLYVRGFDDGYGIDEENGNMPYALYDDGYFEIPLECETFEEFKEMLAMNFVGYCAEIAEHESTTRFPGTLVPGCADNIEAILAGANGVWR